MPSNDYFSATYPDPWQVLGLRLKPFSLGHYFKLHRLGCKFVSDKKEIPTLKDLVLGCLVCSMDSHFDSQKDPFWTWLSRDRPESFLGSIRWRVTNFIFRLRGMPSVTPAELDVYLWGRKAGGKWNFQEKVKLFADYVRLNSEPPGFFEKDRSKPDMESGSHWSHSVIHALVSKCGYLQLEAFNAPIRKALADFYKLCEAEGCGYIMAEELIPEDERL